MMNLQQLVDIADLQGIYALVDETNKRAWIGWSHNVLDALYREVLTFKRAKHPLRGFPAQIEFKLLQKLSDKDNLRFVAKIFKEEFEANGYTVISKNHTGVWKAVITSIADFRGKHQTLSLVSLRGPRGRIIDVACYEKIEDARYHLETHCKPVRKIVYSNNTLTKLYKVWKGK